MMFFLYHENNFGTLFPIETFLNKTFNNFGRSNHSNISLFKMVKLINGWWKRLICFGIEPSIIIHDVVKCLSDVHYTWLSLPHYPTHYLTVVYRETDRIRQTVKHLLYHLNINHLNIIISNKKGSIKKKNKSVIQKW